MLMNLLEWFWFYPSIVMTVWTVLTFVAAWTYRRNRAFPRVFGLHLMMLQLNPKDEILYSRPSSMSVLVYLALGVTPVVGLVLLIVGLAIPLLPLLGQLRETLHKRTKKHVPN